MAKIALSNISALLLWITENENRDERGRGTSPKAGFMPPRWSESQRECGVGAFCTPAKLARTFTRISIGFPSRKVAREGNRTPGLLLLRLKG